MLRRVDEPASHLTHSDQCRTRRTPRGALVERRRGQSLQRLSQAYASAVVVLGSAACTSRKPCAVRWSVTNILARAVLAGTRAQSPVGCDGLARGPSPQQRPGVGPRPPAARLAGCNPSCSCAPRGRARRALCGPREVGRSPGPPGGRQRVGPGGAGSRAPDGRRRIRSAGQHAGTTPPRCCLWGCLRPGGDCTHGNSGANDNPAQSACNGQYEPEICHRTRLWRGCAG